VLRQPEKCIFCHENLPQPWYLGSMSHVYQPRGGSGGGLPAPTPGEVSRGHSHCPVGGYAKKRTTAGSSAVSQTPRGKKHPTTKIPIRPVVEVATVILGSHYDPAFVEDGRCRCCKGRASLFISAIVGFSLCRLDCFQNFLNQNPIMLVLPDGRPVQVPPGHIQLTTNDHADGLILHWMTADGQDVCDPMDLCIVPPRKGEDV
jgi:hypothetical protein